MKLDGYAAPTHVSLFGQQTQTLNTDQNGKQDLRHDRPAGSQASHCSKTYQLNSSASNTKEPHIFQRKPRPHRSKTEDYHDFESQKPNTRPALINRLGSALLTAPKKGQPNLNHSLKIPEKVGNLITSASLTAAAIMSPLLATVRPMPVSGRLEHFRSDIQIAEKKSGSWKDDSSDNEVVQTPQHKTKIRGKIKQNMHKMNVRKNAGTFDERKEYIINLTRALMKFGSPTHRLQVHVEQAGKKLGLNVTCVFLAMASFVHIELPDSTGYELKFIKEFSGIELDKSLETHEVYLKVYNDKWTPEEGRQRLESILRRTSRYNWWQTGLWQAVTSAAICSFGFNGSFVDCLATAPLSFLTTALAYIQNNELYLNIYEVFVIILIAFFSACLAATKKLCYTAMLTSAVVWLLPGFYITLGVLEISTIQNMFTGAVRLVYSVVYALSIGLAIAIGTNLFTVMSSRVNNEITDYTCISVHKLDGPWWQLPVNPWLQFITVPVCLWAFNARMQLAINEKENYISTIFGCAAWTASHFISILLPYQPYLTAIIESFIVGVLGNIYEKYFHGSAYVVMVTPIFFLVPSALRVNNGGLFVPVSEQIDGLQTSYIEFFEIGLKMVSIGISLAVGLSIAVFLVHPNHVSRRKRGAPYTL